jgi:hypothetical protein
MIMSNTTNSNDVVDTIELNGVMVEASVLNTIRMYINQAWDILKAACKDVGDGITECMAKIGEWSIVVAFTDSSAAVYIAEKGVSIYEACTDACVDVWTWLKSLFSGDDVSPMIVAPVVAQPTVCDVCA